MSTTSVDKPASALPVALRKLRVILQRGLVEVRNLALTQRFQQIHDLADALEFLPAVMDRQEEADPAIIRAALEGYQAKYPATAYDYLAILDMDDDAFQEVFRDAWEASAGTVEE